MDGGAEGQRKPYALCNGSSSGEARLAPNSYVETNIQHHNNHKHCMMLEHVMTARQTGSDTCHG
jgi:hypothetical protein